MPQTTTSLSAAPMALTLLAARGGSKDAGPAGPATGETVNSFGTPIVLPIQDKECQNSEGYFQLGKYEFTGYGLSETATELYETDLTGMESSPILGLKSKSVLVPTMEVIMITLVKLV